MPPGPAGRPGRLRVLEHRFEQQREVNGAAVVGFLAGGQEVSAEVDAMTVPVDGESGTRGRFTALYDRCGDAVERRCAGHARSDLVSALSGRILELGAGSGENLAHYRRATQVVAAESSAALINPLKARAAAAQVPVTVVNTPAEQLPFPDSSFDAVVCILTLCSVQDQARVLAEIRRVLTIDGTLVFLEHVRSRSRWVAAAQSVATPLVRRLAAGCRLNRDTVTAIREAGFGISILDTVHPATRTPLMSTFVRGHAYLP